MKTRSDLETYLGFKATIEKQTMTCLIMTGAGQNDSVLRRSPEKPATGEAGNGIINVSLANLMYRVSHLRSMVLS